MLHSRLTVRGDIPKASAVSSTVSPPKHSKFNHAALLHINGGQTVERLVER